MRSSSSLLSSLSRSLSQPIKLLTRQDLAVFVIGRRFDIATEANVDCSSLRHEPGSSSAFAFTLGEEPWNAFYPRNRDSETYGIIVHHHEFFFVIFV